MIRRRIVIVYREKVKVRISNKNEHALVGVDGIPCHRGGLKNI
ncbi:MAG: hypothetical protein ACRD4W_11035 [Nitrososphaeraceae archaeon]